VNRSMFVLCVLGFTSLIVGSVLAIRPVQESIFNSKAIHTFGRLVGPDNAEPEGVSSTTALDKIGYLAVLVGIGFFAVAFLRNRRLA
jgi:hypothetical protein